MGLKISLLISTKNSEETISYTLNSAKNFFDEIIIIDNLSKDKTLDIAEKFNTKIVKYRGNNLGRQYQKGLKKAKNLWIFILDSDEILSEELKKEILFLSKTKKINRFDGYLVPFKNHFLGRPVNYGGENYRILRLFKKNKIRITLEKTHQKYILKSKKLGILKGKIIHYSYRNVFQIFKKFTYYAIEEAKKKFIRREKSSFKKIFLYPIHMFYARFIKDKGYKDGIFRIPLDLGFAYMEFVTYIFLFFYNLKNLKLKGKK